MLGLRVDAFGLDQWGKLFNSRQLLAMTTFTKLVNEAHTAMLEQGLSSEYARAVTTYLGLAVSRLSSDHSSLTRWNPSGEKAEGALGLQALPMVWDFAEINPNGKSVGDAGTAIDLVSAAVDFLSQPATSVSANVCLRDARQSSSEETFDVVITDPPYYDAIDYAGLADFYYVWLKRSIGHVNPDLLNLPLSPKNQQAIMATEKNDPVERRRYVTMMSEAFQSMSASLESGGLTGVVFAHTDPDAWATLIEGLITADLVPNASWPIDTEIGTKLSASSQARLKTSVWMACRKRDCDVGDAFLSDVMERMRPVIRERLLYFWGKGIRGADFFISAIGPALSVFGLHSRVLRPDGEAVSVRRLPGHRAA